MVSEVVISACARSYCCRSNLTGPSMVPGIATTVKGLAAVGETAGSVRHNTTV